MARLTRRQCLELGMIVTSTEWWASALEDALYGQRNADAMEAADVLGHHVRSLEAILPADAERVRAGVREGRDLAIQLKDEGRIDSDPVVDWHDRFTGIVEGLRNKAFVLCSEGTAKRVPKEWMPREP